MRDDGQEREPAISFGQLAQTTGFLVRRLHNSLVSLWFDDIDGAAVRITPVQAGLLILIAENPGVTQARLQKVLDVESATLVKSVSRMVEVGLLVKKRKTSDRRAFLLNLTDRGHEVLGIVSDKMHERDKRLAAGIDPDDYAVFQKVLVTLIRQRSRNGDVG